jgi:hypothetical protein
MDNKQGMLLLVRLHGTDPQCLVAPGSNLECLEVKSKAEALQYLSTIDKRRRLQQTATALRTLTCGEEMMQLLGTTGYSSGEDAWCNRARAVLLERELSAGQRCMLGV